MFPGSTQAPMNDFMLSWLSSLSCRHNNLRKMYDSKSWYVLTKQFLFITSQFITACAIATNCCISDVPSKWESQKFDPPLLPHFSTDFNETQNHERYSAYDPTCKICLMWDDGKGSAKMANFGLLLVLFCTLRVASRLHSKTDHEQWELKTRVSAQESAF